MLISFEGEIIFCSGIVLNWFYQNPNQTTPMKNNQTKKRVGSVNTTNDRQMVESGLRQKPLSIDRSVFTKSEAEKQQLKKARKR